MILESMKMEHEVVAVRSGTVRRVPVGPGDAVAAHAVLVEVEEGAVSAPESEAAEAHSPAAVRPELAELRARVAHTLDAGRARGDGAPSRRRAQNGPREHRRPVRPRELRGVRSARRGGATGAARPSTTSESARRPTA